MLSKLWSTFSSSSYIMASKQEPSNASRPYTLSMSTYLSCAALRKTKGARSRCDVIPRFTAEPDGITNLVLRRLQKALAHPLCGIFNACLTLGHYPSAFRQSHVISVPKPGKDPTSSVGHRPIALLSCIGKKLETLLRRRLSRHMEETKRWSEHQYGFRWRRSTTQAISHLMERATQALNNRNQLMAISFDLQAAFDSTDPNIMWNTLHEASLPRPLLRLIDGFSRHREARLLLGREKWNHLPSRGLPQGSPLSPALFITYADSILGTLTGQVEGQLYADDLIIWKELRADGTDASDLQLTLRKLEDWARTCEMRFNAEKTQTISITRLRKSSLPQLRFNDIS